MIVAGSANPLLLASAGGYNLTRSLRFRSSASAHLNRTPASAGNRKTWTWSSWVKLGDISASTRILFGTLVTSNYTVLGINASGQGSASIGIESISGTVTGLARAWTNAVLRDPSAWYHVVAVLDTTQATGSDRFKIFINGVQQTLTFNTTPTQNQDQFINQASVSHGVMAGYSTAYVTDGYLAETYFIDGQALTPSSFGANSPTTGVWQPKKYAGTYGTNGFYLPFTNNSTTTTLGNDFSGNGNNWTTNNISLTSGATYDSMTDVPTLTSATAANYCVLNPLQIGIATLSNANLTATISNAGDQQVRSTIATSPSSARYYCEVTITTVGGADPVIGIAKFDNQALNIFIGANSTTYGYARSGSKTNNNTSTSYGAAWTAGDVIGIALDNINGNLTFYKNNVSQGVAYSGLELDSWFFAASGKGGFVGEFNFGQRPFTYTPPTGFVALNTFNLPTPSIGATASTQAINYMGATTYSGDSTSNRVITTGGGSDFVWIKRRNSATNNILFDVLRGAGATLYSNLTSAEVANGSFYVQQFGNTGFTLGTGGDAADNITGGTYVAWNWKANGTGVSNTAGSITSTVSANTSAGFSIVTFIGNGTNSTVGHGLGVAPKMIIIKDRSSGSNNWGVWHTSFGTAGNTDYIFLNTTGSKGSAGSLNIWNGTTPTSTVFSIGTQGTSNTNGFGYIAYCFSEVAGYSKFASYTGNGSADGPFVFTGFRPKYVLFWRTDSAGGASMVDSARNPFNVAGQMLYAYGSDAEGTNPYCDLVSNGFKVRGTSLFMNANGGTYIYMAFAESPFKYANAR